MRRLLKRALFDDVFFGLAMVCVVLLAIVLFRQSLRLSPSLLYLVLFWLVLTYLALPRLHRVLTTIYVPDYFIGRTHTSDGLLGDPVNLALLADEAQIHEAMTLAGWTRADPITVRSSWRIAISSVAGRSYPSAPVSPLELFGRTQAFAYQQEVEGNPAQRHHVRFWPTPEGWLLPGGRRVSWLAAGTYDRSVGLSLFTWQVTHKIDADIDIERDYIVDSVLYACPEADCSIIESFSTGYHSRNGGGDAVHTDGNLPVLELQRMPVPAANAAAEARTAPDDPGMSIALRPPALMVGVLLMVLGWLLDAFVSLPQVFSVLHRSQPSIDVSTMQASTVVVLLTTALPYCLSALLAWKVFVGRNWARLMTLTVLCTQLLAQLVGWVGLRAGSLAPSALLSSMAYVLAVYALTSLSVRAWTERRR